MDDLGRHGVAGQLDLRLVDAGDDVGVGHDPAVGVDEAGALDAATAVVGAADLQHRGPGGLDVGVGQQPLGAGGHLHDALGGEGVEVLGEEARADDVVEGAEGRVGAVGQHPVDLGEHRRATHLGGHGGEPGAGDRDAERPGDQQHRHGAEQRAADGVEGTHRLPGDTVAQPRAGELEQRLAERGAQDHDEEGAEGDEHGRVGVAQRDRGEPHPDQPAEQQARGGEGAGDEALPVARERVGQHQDDEEPVEDVHVAHRSSPSRVFWRGSCCRVGSPCSMWAGSARRGASSTCSAQPTKSKSRAMMPAVKPHSTRSLASPTR